jgi:hypothetical protein
MNNDTPSDPAEIAHQVELRRSDVALIRTALHVLLSTLGREEAEEVEQVKALLARLPDVRPSEDRSP